MKDCLERIEKLDRLPQLSIISAPRGAGKSLLIKKLAEKQNMRIQYIGTKVDNIRDLIQDSVSLEQPTLFVITEGDSMSIGAKNALLKITEEPPHNCYIVIEIRDMNTMLDTIQSRGTLFEIDRYSYNDLKQFAIEHLGMENNEDTSNICQISATPGDVKLYQEIGYRDCYNYAEMVYNNIMRVTTGNAFKIKNKLDFTGKGEGFPIDMFFNILLFVCRQHIEDEQAKYIIHCTLNALSMLKVNGANKEMAFDIWVLDCRLRRGEFN
jgi:DNA polymerase III delta prime subunit